MKPNNIKISVIIPAYNHERYIGNTIRSVLEQSYENFELIIINDGSTDGTDSEIRKFDDRRIVYLSRENRGAHNTINEGIEISKGEYISILNSDDVYTLDRLGKCLTFLEQNQDYSAVITEVSGIDGDDDSVLLNKTTHIEAWLNWYKDALKLIDTHGLFIGSFGVNILITTSNYFVRKDVFDKVGKFKGLRYAHDWDMLLRIAQLNKIHLIREGCLQYRMHQSNTVHESDSEAKVKLEVNWLISNGMKRISDGEDYFLIVDALRKNHYLDFEMLALFSMITKGQLSENYLDFNNEVSARLLRELK
ncbi:MAG: glycosyltransferase [Methylococcales bacterium]